MEEREEVILYRQGVRAREIAARLEISVSTVYRVLADAGVPRDRRGENNRKLTDADRDEVVRLYTSAGEDGGWIGVPTIARQFSVRNATIQNVLRTRGVIVRSASESQSPGISRGPRGRPYRVEGTTFTYAERIAARQEARPSCACGCGTLVNWDGSRNRWRRYAGRDHYNLIRSAQMALGEAADRLGRRGRRRGRSRWERVRQFVLDRDGHCCQRCGATEMLRVHHVRPWALFQPWRFVPANLVTLCKSCHTWVHSPANTSRELLLP